MADPTDQLATPRRRFSAYLLDALIGGVFISPFLIGMQLTGDWSGNNFDTASFYAWGAPAWLAYYAGIIYLEGEKGVTPGKWLLSIRVRDADSDVVIGWRRDLGRRLMFIVDAIPLYAGFWWIFIDGRNQCWHDKAAHSIVVSGRAAT